MRRRSSQVEPTRRTTRGAGGTGGRTRGADARAKSADAAAGQRKGGAAPSPLLLLPLLRRLLLAPAPSAAAAHPPWFPGASQSVVRRLCWGEDRHGGIRPAGSLG